MLTLIGCVLAVAFLFVMVGVFAFMAFIKGALITLGCFIPLTVIYCLVCPNRTPKEENKACMIFFGIGVAVAAIVLFW